MVIELNPSFYLASLLPILIFVIIAIVRRKSIFHILSGSFLIFLITSAVIRNIFPINLDYEIPLSQCPDNGLWLKFVMPPFWSFPTGFEFVRATFVIYWTVMPFGLLLGLLSAFTFKPLRKPWFALIFIISVLILTECTCGAFNLILDAKSHLIDSTTSIITLFTFAIGYGAAMLVMKLTPGVAAAFDKVREKPEKDTGENKKIRRKTVEI